MDGVPRFSYLWAIGAIALLGLFAMGYASYLHARVELLHAAEGRYAALRDVRAHALEAHLVGLTDETRHWAGDAVLRRAFASFRRSWDDLGDDPNAAIRALIEAEGLDPAEQHDALEFAPDGADYARAHASYHPWFRRFLTQRGFHDVFLVDPDGDVVYTAYKESDFATNLERGPHRDTALGRVFRDVRGDPTPGRVVISDFERYAPSGDRPAAFAASAVTDRGGDLLGVLVFQIPIAGVNEILQVGVGMGETGETYAVGEDLRMRSDSRFSDRSTVLETRVDTPTVRKALAGESGVETIADYRGVPVLSAYGPIEVDGLRWAVLAEIEQIEVLAPVLRLRRTMGRTGGLVVVGAVVALSLVAILIPPPEPDEPEVAR